MSKDKGNVIKQSESDYTEMSLDEKIQSIRDDVVYYRKEKCPAISHAASQILSLKIKSANNAKYVPPNSGMENLESKYNSSLPLHDLFPQLSSTESYMEEEKELQKIRNENENIARELESIKEII